MFRIIVLIGIAATVVAILGHLVVFGPRRVAGPKTRRAVRRFSIWERLIHVVTVLGFLALATTGFLAVIGQRSPLHGWLWVIHVGAAPVFSFGLTLVVITWARDGLFAPCDWEWTKAFGGYLWGGKHPPAERFNGGQKVYLWAVALLGLVSLVTGLGRAVPGTPLSGPSVQRVVVCHGSHRSPVPGHLRQPRNLRRHVDRKSYAPMGRAAPPTVVEND
jgi:formate dehydrogenase subunit gamma